MPYFRFILYIPLICLHTSIWYNIHLFVENATCNLHLKTFARILKYFIIWFSVQLFTYVKNISTLEIYTGLGFIMVLDLIRVYLYEVAKLQFKNRVTQGIFIDILSIEPFLRKNINENITIEEFYKFGPPKLIKCDYLFDLWNNEKIENPRYDIKHVSQTTEDDLNLGPEAEEISHETRLFNKRALVKNKSKFNSPYKNLKIEEVNTDLKSFVKPETYLFDQDLLTLKKEESKAEPDPDEVVSDENSEVEENITNEQQLDDETNAWLLINEEVRKATQSQPKKGIITKESLRIHFKDKTDYVYNILTFNRSDVLNYTVFRDNIRQINNERQNLYMAIVSNKSLLDKIYYTLIAIEALIIYYIVSKWLNIQPLLIKLCIPIFFIPTWSSIKLIVESFFFIVYSHPYDPGDRIFLDNENYIVSDMSLLTTTLTRWDGYKCIIPNLYIRDKLITNIRRSNAQTWEINVCICKTTNEEKFKKLKNIFSKCIEHDKAYHNITMYKTDIINSNYINLKIHVKHNYNFQNGFLMWNNHTKFLKVLTAAFSIIGIKYLPMKQEINIINKD